MDWDGTYIVDDDLKNIFSKLPAGVHLEVLLDSCHSGTGTREAAALAYLPTEYAIKQRFLILLLIFSAVRRMVAGLLLLLRWVTFVDNSRYAGFAIDHTRSRLT